MAYYGKSFVSKLPFNVGLFNDSTYQFDRFIHPFDRFQFQKIWKMQQLLPSGSPHDASSICLVINSFLSSTLIFLSYGSQLSTWHSTLERSTCILIFHMHIHQFISLSTMTSQNRNGGDSWGTLYRVVLRDIYDSVYILQQGRRWGIHTYKTNAHSFASISKLRSGFAWLDYFIIIIILRHIMLTSLLNSMLWKPQTKFILVTTDQYMTKLPN